MKTTLTPEQSATLIAKGISADKASEIKEYDDEVSQWTHRGAPIFTLVDLLDILPKEIERDMIDCGLDIYYSPIGSYFWRASYLAYSYSKISYVAVEKYAEELIDALYELLLWAIDNGHIDLTK